jgi:hypothetical protein
MNTAAASETAPAVLADAPGAYAGKAPAYLTPADLVERWRGGVSLSTLAGWRCRGGGPAFVKLGRACRYRLTDVEAFEATHRQG